MVLVLGLMAMVLTAGGALAHRSGCHRWHSCPSDSGSYICGDLGHACAYPTGPEGASYPTEVAPKADPPGESSDTSSELSPVDGLSELREVAEIRRVLAAKGVRSIQDLQRLLVNEGYDPGPIDGDLGPRTMSAWTSYQESGYASRSRSRTSAFEQSQYLPKETYKPDAQIYSSSAAQAEEAPSEGSDAIWPVLIVLGVVWVAYLTSRASE